MDLHLKDKVVAITGGGSGIGKAGALEFAREGCRVAICGRTAEKLERAKKELEALGVPVLTAVADVTRPGDIKRFGEAVAERFGGMDIWVNNAGFNQVKHVLDYTEEDWNYIMDIDLKSVFFGSQTAARHMIAGKKGGVILNIASYACQIPHEDRAIYAAAKCGVLSLTRTFAAALAPDNIRVVSLIPGMIKTEMTEQRLADPEYNRKCVRDIAQQRLGESEDLAKPLVFLASDAAAYITGTHVEVSGGKFCVQHPEKSWEGR